MGALPEVPTAGKGWALVPRPAPRLISAHGVSAWQNPPPPGSCEESPQPQKGCKMQNWIPRP